MTTAHTTKVDRREIYRLITWLGAALIIAGYVRYSVQGELLDTSKVLLIGGGVMFVLGMALNYRAIMDFFSKRSARLGTNVLVLAIAVVVILGFANFLGYRYHKRFDWTSEKLFTLSDETDKVVRGLKQNVTIYRFAKTPDQDLNDRMAEYVNLNPSKMHYEVVDPESQPGIAKQYGVTTMGQLIAASGSKNNKIDGSTEQDLTSAILQVTQDRTETACFVTGHGEKSTSNSQAQGYSVAADELKKEGYQIKDVNLVTDNGVPSDCTALIDNGPTQAFFPQEVDMLTKYLNGGGRALFMIDPGTDPKLDSIFQAWNINVASDYAIDVSGVGRLFGTGPAVPLVVDYGDNPITRNLQGTMTFFPLARTVSIADTSKTTPEDTELLKTSARSFTVPNLGNGQVKFDAKTDKQGPLSLAVAADQKETGDKTARLVVVGDSDFAENQWVTLQRNGDLFYNTVNWLASQEQLISIRPKNPENRRVDLTESQQRGLYWFSLVLLPGCVVIGGIYIWLKRR